MMSSRINDILIKLERAQIIARKDEVYELRHDSLAQKIASKLTVEERAVKDFIAMTRNSVRFQTVIPENIFIQLQPYRPKIEAFFLKTGETPCIEYLQNEQARIAHEQEERQNQLKNERHLRSRAENSLWWARVIAFIAIVMAVTAMYLGARSVSGTYRRYLMDAQLAERGAHFQEATEHYKQALSYRWYPFRALADLKDSIELCNQRDEMKKIKDHQQLESDSLQHLSDSFYFLSRKDTGVSLAKALAYEDASMKLAPAESFKPKQKQFITAELKAAFNDAFNKAKIFEEAGVAGKYDALKYFFVAFRLDTFARTEEKQILDTKFKNRATK